MKIVTMAMLEYVEETMSGEKKFSIQFIGINDALVSKLEHDWAEIANEKMRASICKIEKLKEIEANLAKEISEKDQELKASKKWFRKYNEKEKLLIELIEQKKHEHTEILEEINLLTLDNAFTAHELQEKARKFILQHGFECVSISSSSVGTSILKTEVWQLPST